MLTGSFTPPLMGPAQQLVVLMHGYGSFGENLTFLTHAWQEALPHAAFLCLSAPDPCPEIGPYARPNARARQWFDLEDWQPPQLLSEQKHFLPSMRAAASKINITIDAALHENMLADHQLALMGFSQGAMMALYTGLTRPKTCAGLLGYGGALLCETQEVRSKPPVFLYHGHSDEAVMVTEITRAKDQLDAWAVPVDTHVRPRLGHGIDDTGVARGATFLKKIFTQKEARRKDAV